MIENISRDTKRFGVLHQVLFCLNLGFAVALFITLLLVEKRVPFVHGNAQSPDMFHRIWFDINIVLHRPPLHPLGGDFVLMGFTLVFSVLFLFCMYLLPRVAVDKFILSQAAGVTALVAVPLSWFFQAHGSGIWMIVLELFVIGGALYLSRARPNPLWFIVLLIHYCLWSWFVYVEQVMVLGIGPFRWPRDYGLNLAAVWPLIFSLVAPCAGFVWVLYRIRVLSRYSEVY